MTKPYEDEIYEYLFRTLEVMASQELPESAPSTSQPETDSTVCSELISTTAGVRKLYQEITQKVD